MRYHALIKYHNQPQEEFLFEEEDDKAIVETASESRGYKDIPRIIVVSDFDPQDPEGGK